MPTEITGKITNIPPTGRKHLVELFQENTTQPPSSGSVLLSGATTDLNGNYRIYTSTGGFASDNYRIVVDGIWVSTTTIQVMGDSTNPGCDVAIGTSPTFPTSAPATGQTHVYGWAIGHANQSAAYKQNGTPIKQGTVNAAAVYRFLAVPSSSGGTNYDPFLNGSAASPDPVTVKDTYDIERHDLS